MHPIDKDHYHYFKEKVMRELSDQEVTSVSGGIYQALLPVAVSYASRFVTNRLVKHYIGNFSLSYGTYEAAVGLGPKISR